jgi:hypothetical protein
VARPRRAGPGMGGGGATALGGSSLEFRDASNPGAEPVFALNDGDEVHHWQYLEGIRRHTERSLHVATEAMSRGMRDAIEVSSNLFGFRIMVRSLRSAPAASRSSFVMRAVCGRHSLGNRL